MEINSGDFNLPPQFVMPQAHKAVADSEGVSSFDYGKQGYVSWRFAWDARPWKHEKVKKHRLGGSDTIPVILFYRDKDNQIPIKLKRKMRYEERVSRFGEPFDKAMPMELEEGQNPLDAWELPLGFDSQMFQVAFQQWKEKGERPGTPISQWRADPGQVNTLAALGIFTVDAFGEMSEEAFGKLIASLPRGTQVSLKALHDEAIGFVNRYGARFDADEFVSKIEVLENSNEKLKEDLENKDAEIERLLAKIKGSSKKGKKKKSEPEVVDGQIQDIEL